MLIFEQRDVIQEISTAVFARALYSAYVLDRSMGCFLQLKDIIRLLPKKTQYPLVDIRLSRLLAQSASEKA